MILLLLVAMTTLIFMTTTPIQSLKLFQNLSVKRRGFKSASRLLLNRILIDSSECISGLDINSNELIIAELKSTDYRYEHINKVILLIDV